MPPLIVTVGHLAPGVETVLHAMALLRVEHPELEYVVAGHTHPELARRDGERYRWCLEALVDDLGLAGRVAFDDRASTTATQAALVARATAVIVPYRTVEHFARRPVEIALSERRPLIVTRACIAGVPRIDPVIRWIGDDDEECAAAVHDVLARAHARIG